MGLTTPRYVLRYPVAADPDNVPADMLRLATDLDNKMRGYSQGTLSARPAAGVSGRVYRATDDGFLYQDTGSAWIIVARPIADVASVLAYNAAWPASPVNGQETDRYADAAGTQIWRFRYDAASPAGFRWHCIGGSPLRIAGTARALTANAGTLMTSASLVPGVAGMWRVTWNVLTGTTASNTGNLGLVNSTTGPTITASAFNTGYCPVYGLAGAQIQAPWVASGSGQFSGDITAQYDLSAYAGGSLNTYWFLNAGGSNTFTLDTYLMPLRLG
jgi:hypothetical protein